MRSRTPRPSADSALKGLVLEYEPLDPIKQGLCGAPAPILLKSIGSDPKVTIICGNSEMLGRAGTCGLAGKVSAAGSQSEVWMVA